MEFAFLALLALTLLTPSLLRSHGEGQLRIANSIRNHAIILAPQKT